MGLNLEKEAPHALSWTAPNLGTRTVLQQIISLAGAILILVAYLANSKGWMGPKDPAYNLMNLVGALLLLWIAIVDQRAGFVVLELSWALITIPPLLRPRAKDAK
jgi:uncharacterized membrane protein